MSEKFLGVSFLEIGPRGDGQRVDNYLISKLKGVPKSHIYRIIRKGEVRVNKKRVKANSKLALGDSLRLPPIQHQEKPKTYLNETQRIEIKDNIVFEDSNMLVFSKPAGMAVHGGSGLSFGAIETLRAYFSNDDLELVHRLDKATSGCLLLAKKRGFLTAVHQLFRDRKVKKTYLAILSGHWHGSKQQIVDKPILKQGVRGGERVVRIDSEGKPSTTMFKLLENYADACLVEAHPLTGRTHQIRVHAASLGHPILGDSKYGNRELESLFDKKSLNRLYLHSYKLHFDFNGLVHFQVPTDNVWNHMVKILKTKE